MNGEIKTKKYWLKGGIIIGIIWVILMLIIVSRVCYMGSGICEWDFRNILKIISIPANVVILLSGFPAGFLVGLVFGKIKSKKLE